MNGKCDWCGKEGEVVQTGLFVYATGKTRIGFECKDDRHIGNPVFENLDAWSIWSSKHKILAKHVINSGNPKYQYSEFNGGRAWW